MTMNKSHEGDKLTVKIEGKIDALTAPELDKELNSLYDGLKELILDITGVTYISSAGLRVLLKAQKTMNKQGSMSITGSCKDVLEIFEVTGFDDILNIV